MRSESPAIITRNVSKRLGKHQALDDVGFQVNTGSVCGLLGPNGAGKTTLVRVLTTLLRLDDGEAEVAGFNVSVQAAHVRRRIGLAGQQPTVDEILTGRGNLIMFGKLFHLSPAIARRRADELLDQFNLGEDVGKQVKRYSGGMRRRLDLAASFILTPEVLFLDEPTTGLDPRNRNDVWNAIRTLASNGTTVLLTTQYLDEADQLADQIVVLDTGRVIANDSPSALKSHIGGDQIEVILSQQAPLDIARNLARQLCGAEPDVDEEAHRIRVPAREQFITLSRLMRAYEDAGISITDIALRRPTLDDVFLRLTGRHAREEEAA